MRHILMAAIACAMLTGCGKGGEDFTISLARPANQVMAAFGDVAPQPLLAQLVHGISIRRSRPADGQVLYTIPGSDGDETTILLTFEPIENGARTIIHAAVDVPRTKAVIDGGLKVLSESKVEQQLRETLEAAAGRIEKGQDTGATRQELSKLFSALAIVTNKSMLERMLKLKNDPSLAINDLGGLTELDGDVDSAPAEISERRETGQPVDDPNTALRKEQWRTQVEEARERRQQREAAEPMDDAKGESANGDSGDSGW